MKFFKSSLAIVIAILMVFSLLACGGEQDTDNNNTNKSGAFKETTIELSESKIVVVGAERIVDYDEKDALRVWFDITNTTEESKYLAWTYEFKATQDDYELVDTSSGIEYTVKEEGNDIRDVRPGVTVRATKEVVMKPDGGLITLSFIDSYDEEKVFTVELDPKNLPGAPKEEFVPATIDDPKWLDGYPEKGQYEAFGDLYDVEIEKFELTESYSGEKLIRIYFNFKNNSDEATAFHMNISPIVYQDGVGLDTGYADVSVTEDDNYSQEIEVGESIKVACCYELISESPVEVDLTDLSGGGVGVVYNIK